MVEIVTPLRKGTPKIETTREKAFRLEREAKAAADHVVSEAIQAFEVAMVAAFEAVDLISANRGIVDELRRLCNDAETRLQTIKAIQART